MNFITSVLYPALSVIITGSVIPFMVKFIVAKIGAVNLAKDIKTAGLIWDALEEDGRLGDLAKSKLSSFMSAMKARTKLSDEDILLLNKAIAGIANAGKEAIIKEVEPITEAVTPTLKYFDKDGVELVQKVTA